MLNCRHRVAAGRVERGACSGFTLMELMIVIAIIVVIAAIAIPNLMRSRITANEGAAISNMRTISSAEQQYQSAGIVLDARGVGTYGTLTELKNTTPAFVDEALGSGIRQGYRFAAVPSGGPGSPAYSANADPVLMGASGSRGFYVDESGVITFVAGGVAGPSDNPIQ